MSGKTDRRQHIRRRLVLFFPGFEPLGAEQHRGRFEHALKKTAPVFGSSFVASGLETRGSGVAGFHVEASGQDWKTKTDIAIFDWSPVLEHFAKRPVLIRFAAGVGALLALVADGTLHRYLATSWRYGFFFFYPFFLIAACVLAGFAAAAFFPSGWQGFLAGFTVFVAGLALCARKAHLLLMMDDWAFAARLAAGGDPVIERTLQSFRQAANAELADPSYGETIVIGHSLGCVFAVDALAAMGRHDDKSVCLMTAGSSLLKIALNKRAAWVRENVKCIVAAQSRWLDIQALTDVISFYGADPAAACGAPVAPFLRIVKIRFRKMLLPDSYAKGKFNLFRTHRQFVLAAERRYFYSLHQIACGPVPFDMIWKSGGLPEDMPPSQNPD